MRRCEDQSFRSRCGVLIRSDVLILRRLCVYLRGKLRRIAATMQFARESCMMPFIPPYLVGSLSTHPRKRLCMRPRSQKSLMHSGIHAHHESAVPERGWRIRRRTGALAAVDLGGGSETAVIGLAAHVHSHHNRLSKSHWWAVLRVWTISPNRSCLDSVMHSKCHPASQLESPTPLSSPHSASPAVARPPGQSPSNMGRACPPQCSSVAALPFARRAGPADRRPTSSPVTEKGKDGKCAARSTALCLSFAIPLPACCRPA